MTILDMLRDPALFGALAPFRDLTTWRRWLVFLRGVYGLTLDGEDLALFREHTGRAQPRPGGYQEAVAVVGRQSGKTRLAATLAAFEAATAQGEADGTETYALLIAQDHRAALRTLFRYAAACFETVPILAHSVRERRAETLTLETGVVLAAYPCRPPAIRGLRARVAVLDELAFYRSSEGFPTDMEMLRAVRPTLATTGGRLIVLSSPYAQTGALYDLYRRHYGRAESEVLVWQAAAPAMNPTLPAGYLQRMAQDDPDAYRSEVLGEFRAGVSTLLDPAVLAEAVDAGVRERVPEPSVSYVSFVDAASGSGGDAFALALAHRDGARAVLDLCRAWRPPFNPSGVIAEVSDLLKRYGLRATRGDRYAPGFVAEGFRREGVSYEASDLDKSALFLEFLPLLNAGQVVLLDQPELLRELRGLERRRGPTGKDRVTHPPGSHDDRANAVAGALVQCRRIAAPCGILVGPPESASAALGAHLRALQQARAPQSAPWRAGPATRLTRRLRLWGP